MIGECGLELSGHQAGISCGFEEVIEAGEQLVARGIVEHEPAADAAAERQKLGRAQALDEARVASEDDAEQLARVELLAGQDTQLVEDGREGFLGLVDDQTGRVRVEAI